MPVANLALDTFLAVGTWRVPAVATTARIHGSASARSRHSGRPELRRVRADEDARSKMNGPPWRGHVPGHEAPACASRTRRRSRGAREKGQGRRNSCDGFGT